jgi:hypothetical protein
MSGAGRSEKRADATGHDGSHCRRRGPAIPIVFAVLDATEFRLTYGEQNEVISEYRRLARIDSHAPDIVETHAYAVTALLFGCHTPKDDA